MMSLGLVLCNLSYTQIRMGNFLQYSQKFFKGVDLVSFRSILDRGSVLL